MGIAVVFDRVTVHRYHPFRLVGAFRSLYEQYSKGARSCQVGFSKFVKENEIVNEKLVQNKQTRSRMCLGGERALFCAVGTKAGGALAKRSTRAPFDKF